MSSLAVRARWALVEGEIVTDRWIVTEGDKIAAIARDRPAADTVIDRPDLFVLPGLIDLHNHVFTEALVRGRSEDLSKEGFETNLIYGLLMPIGKLAMDHLSADECEAIAEMGFMQLMKSGVTTLMESFRAGLTEPAESEQADDAGHGPIGGAGPNPEAKFPQDAQHGQHGRRHFRMRPAGLEKHKIGLRQIGRAHV